MTEAVELTAAQRRALECWRGVNALTVGRLWHLMGYGHRGYLPAGNLILALGDKGLVGLLWPDGTVSKPNNLLRDEEYALTELGKEVLASIEAP